MTFGWDKNKSIKNVLKHGVPFETAQKAFFDEKRKIFLDGKHSVLESRYYCYGAVDGAILTVRFTVREHAIRIIGAGYWRKGRKIYHEDQQK